MVLNTVSLVTVAYRSTQTFRLVVLPFGTAQPINCMMQSLRVLCDVGTRSSNLRSRVRALKSERAKAQAINRRRLRPGVSHIPIHVGFVENVVPLERFISEYYTFLPFSNIPPVLHIHLNTAVIKWAGVAQSV